MKKLQLTVFIIFLFFSANAQLNMIEAGNKPYIYPLSDVWGYADSQSNEYALVGVYNGFSIVDVTDPSSLSEIYFEEGVESIWRDIKTWGEYAYVSTEGGGGILIVDLSPLPGDIINSNYFTGSTFPFSTVHNLYIDEYGKLYIFGSDSGTGGAIICDLTADPMNPTELGRFDDYYFHDGMARGDTLWGGAIYEGVFSAVDVSDPATPYVMATKSTPSTFTHNTWISDNGKFLFTTDEVSNGYIGAYDVSDFDNIVETDRVQSSPGNNIIPHNVHVLNDFLVTSYYSDGITIHDAARPHNLIEVGNYDTSPNFSGSGYNGSWGAYPFLPSGNVLASDIEEGLSVLIPEYKRGCYFEGTVVDSVTGLSINNVEIKILSTEYSEATNFSGDFAFGTPTAGVYDIEFYHPDYNTKTLEAVSLDNGVLTEMNVELSSWFTSIENELETAQITAGPNPFNESLNLNYTMEEKLSSDARISVYSMGGLLLEEHKIYSQESSLKIGSRLSSGIYIVKLHNANTFVAPIRIQKL